MPKRDARKRREAWIELATHSAQRHGQDGEPEQEVGDLQALVYQMWKAMPDDARAAVIRGFFPYNGHECPTCASPLRMCADADPACMHCDECDWCGDPVPIAPVSKLHAPAKTLRSSNRKEPTP